MRLYMSKLLLIIYPLIKISLCEYIVEVLVIILFVSYRYQDIWSKIL